MAAAQGPVNAMGLTPRLNRLTAPTDRLNANVIAADGTGVDKIVGVGWGAADPMAGGTGAVQQVFNDNCVSCHNQSNTAGIAGYTISNAMGGVVAQFTFDLSDRVPITINYGPATFEGPAIQTYSASYHDGGPGHGSHREEQPQASRVTSGST